MSQSSPEGIILGKGSKLISAEIKIKEELQPNEVLVKDFKIIEHCLGTKKTNTRLILTFTKEQKDFDYVDVFLTTE